MMKGEASVDKSKVSTPKKYIFETFENVVVTS